MNLLQLTSDVLELHGYELSEDYSSGIIDEDFEFLLHVGDILCYGDEYFNGSKWVKWPGAPAGSVRVVNTKSRPFKRIRGQPINVFAPEAEETAFDTDDEGDRLVKFFFDRWNGIR